MTQLVDRLESEELVRRVDDPKERRIVKASITDAGRERQEAGAERIEQLHQDFAASVKEEDRAALGRLLTVLE